MRRLPLSFLFMSTVLFCDCDQNDGDWKELDKQGYEAIVQLHKHLDDDKSGSIDRNESTGFLQEELNVKDKDPLARRQQAFHHNNDESITVEDLWRRWLHSDERKWTTDETIAWLVNSVELPQYANIFIRLGINGTHLPRLAVQNSSYSFLQSVLSISSSPHRQKLQVKAMDVVLFGYRGMKANYAKDILLVALLIVAVGAYWFAMYQRKASLKQAHALTSQLEKLKDMEQEFVELQNKLEEERCRQESCKTSIVDEEIENRGELETLKYQLQEVERQRLYRNPLLLSLLKKTYDMEITRINQQKLDSLKEMNEARELVEKLRKKQSSLFSQIRSVHGPETELIDERIVSIRQKLESTSRAMEECEQRWQEIEYLMGLKIMNTSTTNAESVRGFAGGIAPTSGYSRPHYFTAGSTDLDSDVGLVPLTDADAHAHLTESITRAAYLKHYLQGGVSHLPQRMVKPQLNATGSATTFFPHALGGMAHGDNTSQVYRPKFKIGESDILRSASASDLLANGSSPVASEIKPVIEPSYQSMPTTVDGNTRRLAPARLAQDGKKSSQNSMESTTSGSPTETITATKSKKKLLSFFGGKKTE